MKNTQILRRPARKSSAFTLVELLTVVAIISILMGLLFPTLGVIMDTARKTEAKNDVTQIVSAIKAYYTEYGKYPINAPPTTPEDKSLMTGNAELFNILRAVDGTGNTGHVNNPRKITFIEAKTAKPGPIAKNGIAPSGDWADPWGTFYLIKIDGTYDNSITNPYSGTNANPVGEIRTGAIAWSQGIKKDGPVSPTNPQGKTDQKKAVVSWQ